MQTNLEARRYVQGILGLAFLPADEIQQQYDYLLINLSQHLTRQFQNFNFYYQNFWLNRMGAENFSVFGLEARTNNISESYNCRLEARMTPHPFAWDLYCMYN